MDALLSDRQVLLYAHTIDIYEPKGDGITTSGEMRDIYWTRKYVGIPCYVVMTPEENFPTPVGRTKEQNVFTLDKVNLPTNFVDGSVIEIQDGWGVLFTTSNHPQRGNWWIVQGNTQTIAATERRNTNFQHTLLQRETRPAMIS